MYIDIDMFIRRRLAGMVSFRLNGKIINKVVRAKSGKNGFVEYYPQPLTIKNDEVVRVKKRGNVKLSFNLKAKL
tara:strand:+ start:1528 stop:1749 length:222 start_codon:yes stop_codon:yes gene_type:complete